MGAWEAISLNKMVQRNVCLGGPKQLGMAHLWRGELYTNMYMPQALMFVAVGLFMAGKAINFLNGKKD